MNYYPTQRNLSPAQAWCTGWLIQHLGFLGTFLLFAVLAAGGSIWFQVPVPETKPAAELESVRHPVAA